MEVIHPVILYVAVALGAIGVGLSLPRRGVNPQAIGAVIAASAGGLVILLLSLHTSRSGEGLPNPFFYVFSVIALGASLRMITHPRPIYAALFFIMTIISSAGLYLILAAEFMAFALIIVYAGAILITYLFVIMMATQSPTLEQNESLQDYDTTSREPIAATLAGFVLLAVLTSMLFTGLTSLPAPSGQSIEPGLLVELPGKVERAMRRAGALPPGASVATDDAGRMLLDPVAGTVTISTAAGGREVVELPAGLGVGNVERVGMSLLGDYPGLIEIAGIILLMAMLGAIVLARRKVMADDEDRAAMAAKIARRGTGGGL